MKKINILLSTALSVLAVASCASKLDIKPQTALYDEQILALIEAGDENAAKLLQNLYTKTMQYMHETRYASGSGDSRYYTQSGLDHMRNLEGNDIVFGSITNAAFGWDEYALQNLSDWKVDKNAVYWQSYYGPINAVNKILNYLTAEGAAANKSFADGRARCLLVRAHQYSNLMENYQKAYTNGGKDLLGLPIYTKYDPTQEAVERSTATETYKFIMGDIDEAISLLQKAGIGYTENTEDFDLAVAYFLKARVALWTGDWNACIAACDNIINSGKFSFIPEKWYGGKNTAEDGGFDVYANTNAFLCIKANPETILGFTRGGEYATTSFFSWLSATARSTNNGQAMIDQRLYDKIAANDFRKDAWLAEDYGPYEAYSGSGTVNIEKYAAMKFTGTHGLKNDGITIYEDRSEYGKVEFTKFRLSEVVLMKAEAQAQAGQDAAAKATLNTLLAARTKAGAATLTCDNYPAMAGMSALQMCQLQWRIEMWGENGREFFNNKRWGIPVDRSDSKNHINKNTLEVDGMTLQIPEMEILYGKSVQN